MIGNSRLAVVDQLLDGAPHLVDRDGEADADVAALADRLPPTVAIAELTPITSPSRLTSGPPELPGLIAASVWMALMYALSLDRLLAAGGDRPVLRADDAAGDGAGQAQRRADGEHRVADDDAVGVAERQRGQVLGVHLEHREVVARGLARRPRPSSSCRR